MSELETRFFSNMSQLFSLDCVDESELGDFRGGCDLRVVVAVSGGSDSMGLLLLSDIWAKKNGIKLFAVTVDHGLRENSFDEANQVGLWAKHLGVQHTVLRWQHEKLNIPFGKKQTLAREARYDLLIRFCKQNNIKNILVAHTLDDQLETFLMRKNAGSGDYGLACMNAKRSITGGINIIRPLLNIRKKELVDFLVKNNFPWVEDPSNRDVRYKRVEIRQRLYGIADLEKKRLMQELFALAKGRSSLEKITKQYINNHVIVNEFGYAIASREAFECEDRLFKRNILRRLLWAVGGNLYPLSDDKLNALVDACCHMKNGEKRGAGNCLIVKKKEAFHIMREVRNIKDETFKEGLLWDRRFLISLPNNLKFKVANLSSLSGLGHKSINHFYVTDGMVSDGLGVLPVAISENNDIVFLSFGGHYKENCALFTPASPLVEDFIYFN